MRRLAWLAIGTCACAACNAILDNHDRVLDDLDASTPRDSGKPPPVPPGTPPPPNPAPMDASNDDGSQVVTIPVSKTYTSPNGATFDYDGGGGHITGYTTATHPALVPSPQPSIPSDTYTVAATIQAGQSGEFGILARIQADYSCALLGSKYGTATEPFLASVSSADWNPNMLANGASYTFTTGGKYKMKLHVDGVNAQGKMWLATAPEPDWQVQTTMTMPLPWSTGRGVGYYVYNTYDTVLLDMTVTVP